MGNASFFKQTHVYYKKIARIAIAKITQNTRIAPVLTLVTTALKRSDPTGIHAVPQAPITAAALAIYFGSAFFINWILIVPPMIEAATIMIKNEAATSIEQAILFPTRPQ